MVRHTHYYSATVTRTNAGAIVETVWYQVDSVPTGRPTVTQIALAHVDWPEWLFVLALAPNGTVSAFGVGPRSEWRGDPGDVLRPVGASIDDAERITRHLQGEPQVIGPPVTLRMLRRIPWGDLERHARGELRRYMESVVLPASARVPAGDALRLVLDDWLEGLETLVGDLDKRPGSVGRPDIEYAALAALYVAEVDNGNRNATSAVADQLGYGLRSVGNWLREARRRELLTDPPPGRAGGSLTPKAKQLLEAKRGEH
jgi:hypothetical protein